MNYLGLPNAKVPKFYKQKSKLLLVLISSILCMSFTLTLKSFMSLNISQLELASSSSAHHGKSDFNPRRVTLQLYEYINEFNKKHHKHHPLTNKFGGDFGVNFHWDDWVDLSTADHILNKERKKYVTGECSTKSIKYGNVNSYFLESYDTKIKRGMTNLYCSKDIPSKIILSTDHSYIEVPVVGKNRFGSENLSKEVSKNQVIDEMIKAQSKKNRKNTKNSDENNSEPQENEDDINESFIYKNYNNLQKQIDVNSNDFLFDLNTEIYKLKDKKFKNQLSQEDDNYLKFLTYSNNLVDTSDKYFKYPWISSDVATGRSHHLAYPFFKRYISDRERQSVIHHMVRAWFQFAESNGFVSWINYGSLLGWAYNGVEMPWDTDVDVQMPIVHLDRLGRQFNKSLIVENPRYGNAKYLLEISPTYTRQGNGKNHIDARFIDINNGLYIDISALSHTNDQPPKSYYKDLNEDEIFKTRPVHCKNWNWHSLEELLPIRHTYFEGASIYIPRNVSGSLTRKYGSGLLKGMSNHFADHNYQKDIKLWVPDRICTHPPEIEDRFMGDNSELTLEGACNDESLRDEYKIVYDSAQRHLQLNKDMDRAVNYDINTLGDLPYYRKDPWDYYNDIHEKTVNNKDWYLREEIIKE